MDPATSRRMTVKTSRGMSEHRPRVQSPGTVLLSNPVARQMAPSPLSYCYVIAGGPLAGPGGLCGLLTPRLKMVWKTEMMMMPTTSSPNRIAAVRKG